MTSEQIKEAVYVITLMRKGNKRHIEIMDRNEKKRIDEKNYQWQLRQIEEGVSV